MSYCYKYQLTDLKKNDFNFFINFKNMPVFVAACFMASVITP